MMKGTGISNAIHNKLVFPTILRGILTLALQFQKAKSMSKKFIFLSLIVFLLIGVVSSCKYEEGPFVSFRTKKERVANTWKIEKIIKDDGKEKTGDSVPDTEYTYTDGGDYKEDGNELGDWEFKDSKEEIYHEVNTPFGTVDYSHEILKLKEKELWVEDEDGDEIHYEPA